MSRPNAATGESQSLPTNDVTFQMFLFDTTDIRRAVRWISYFNTMYSALFSFEMAILFVLTSSLMTNDFPINSKMFNGINLQNMHQSDSNNLRFISLAVIFVLCAFVQVYYVLNQSKYVFNNKNMIDCYGHHLFISIVCVFYNYVIRYFQIDFIIVNVSYPIGFICLINAFMVIVNLYYAILQGNIIALEQYVNLTPYPTCHIRVLQMIALSDTVIFEPRYGIYEIYEIYDDVFDPEVIQWSFNDSVLQMYLQGHLTIQVYFMDP